MKWFRRNIRTGSRLALFALALQLVLSFGHFHWDTAQAAAAAQSQAALAHVQDAASGVPSQAQQQPASHDDNQSSNEPCAICAVISMASQIALAAPAVLPLPHAVELVSPEPASDSIHLGSPRPAFRSRAPPLS